MTGAQVDWFSEALKEPKAPDMKKYHIFSITFGQFESRYCPTGLFQQLEEKANPIRSGHCLSLNSLFFFSSLRMNNYSFQSFMKFVLADNSYWFNRAQQQCQWAFPVLDSSVSASSQAPTWHPAAALMNVFIVPVEGHAKERKVSSEQSREAGEWKMQVGSIRNTHTLPLNC